VTQNAVADGISQIQTLTILFQEINYSQALLVVAKTGQELSERHLARMTEGGVAEIVPHADRFDQILVEAECPTDCPGDLRHFERVGEPGPVVIAGWCNEDLCLVHQPPEALGVDDAIAVPLKG
jgi:hypothetical protein